MDRNDAAHYFDTWYANMAGPTVKDEIHNRHLGLPPELQSTSLVGWDALVEITAELSLRPDELLVDLACGRGGYGLEIARRTGARLIGVDFSAEAIRQARDLARELDRDADFRVGDLTSTGLADGSVDAVLCIDAIQFADPPEAAYAELHRILAPGGRVVLTCWEPAEQPSAELPDRLIRVDLATGLEAAGFDNVRVVERPAWRAVERPLWEEAAALDPGDDPALRSFHDEGVRVLDTWDDVRRVLATAQTSPTRH